MSFKIDDSVPIPERNRALTSYPFDELEVGQSFFVDHADAKKVFSARQSMSYFGRKTGRKFVSHVQDGGVRFWRIA